MIGRPLAPQPVRLSPHYFDHPKTIRAGRAGRELHLRSICHANLHLSDGFIDHDAAIRLSRATLAATTGQLAEVTLAETLDLIATLITGRLWDEVDGGYAIHDYADYQVCRESLLTRRARDRRRKRHGLSARNPRGIRAPPSPHTPHPVRDLQPVQSVSSSPAEGKISQPVELNDAYASAELAGLDGEAQKGSPAWFAGQLPNANERTIPAIVTVARKWSLPEAALHCALEETLALGSRARSPAALFVAKLDSYGREGRYAR